MAFCLNRKNPTKINNGITLPNLSIVLFDPSSIKLLSMYEMTCEKIVINNPKRINLLVFMEAKEFYILN